MKPEPPARSLLPPPKTLSRGASPASLTPASLAPLTSLGLASNRTPSPAGLTALTAAGLTAAGRGSSLPRQASPAAAGLAAGLPYTSRLSRSPSPGGGDAQQARVLRAQLEALLVENAATAAARCAVICEAQLRAQRHQRRWISEPQEPTPVAWTKGFFEVETCSRPSDPPSSEPLNSARGEGGRRLSACSTLSTPYGDLDLPTVMRNAFALKDKIHSALTGLPPPPPPPPGGLPVEEQQSKGPRRTACNAEVILDTAAKMLERLEQTRGEEGVAWGSEASVCSRSSRCSSRASNRGNRQKRGSVRRASATESQNLPEASESTGAAGAEKPLEIKGKVRSSENFLRVPDANMGRPGHGSSQENGSKLDIPRKPVTPTTASPRGATPSPRAGGGETSGSAPTAVRPEQDLLAARELAAEALEQVRLKKLETLELGRELAAITADLQSAHIISPVNELHSGPPGALASDVQADCQGVP